ncbi:MAG: carbon storage regulator CsrA [Campylobacterota bacterium]|nr:carbon storage regulator CsrA [Campylobacterota bacterium]
MLILSRKSDESIVINENITVKIVAIEKGVVKIGIDAPSEVSILRSELTEAVTHSNKKASFHIDASILNKLSESLKK